MAAGEKDDLVPQSIIFPLGSGNFLSSQLRSWKFAISTRVFKSVKNKLSIYSIYTIIKINFFFGFLGFSLSSFSLNSLGEGIIKMHWWVWLHIGKATVYLSLFSKWKIKISSSLIIVLYVLYRYSVIMKGGSTILEIGGSKITR